MAADVQITDGLQGGERVVTVGAFELDKEDEDVLAKTKIQVQAPKMPEEERTSEVNVATTPSLEQLRYATSPRLLVRPALQVDYFSGY